MSRHYYCNPLNLPYKYQLFDQSRGQPAYREAADPSLVCFRGLYYLFPSMTGGFFTSGNLCDWTYHPFTSEIPIYDYAPDACVMDGELWFCASRGGINGTFFHSPDPIYVPFASIPAAFEFWDPHMFLDDDGRLYLFWGCSNKSPLWGVELEKGSMRPLCEPVGLIWGDAKHHGFERLGENNQDSGKAPFIEGPWMTKHHGKYHLQYAAPATEYNIYSDGIYVADYPLGPYRPARNNPYAHQPGGFITGSGHGSTLKDDQGRYWHTDSLGISCSHPYERRLGLWRAGFDEDGMLFCDQRFGDWPHSLDAAVWSDPEWMLLSYAKPVSTSSGKNGGCAVDENIRTWWSAEDTDIFPWITVDLKQISLIHAVQINFADEALFPSPGPDAVWSQYLGRPRVIEDRKMYTRWLLEASQDGLCWSVLQDKRACHTDLPHDLWVTEEGVNARYIRLTVTERPYGQAVRISGLRVFGKAFGVPPKKARILSARRLPLDGFLRWEAEEGVHACVCWGHDPQKLYHSRMVYGKQDAVITALLADQSAWVRVDCFNEFGVTRGDPVSLQAFDKGEIIAVGDT